MPRRHVELKSGEFYHVYHRGNDRQPIFFDRESYFFYLRRIRKYLFSACDIAAYCLMPNHYHLLVRVAEGEFSRAMQSLGQSYANALNKRWTRTGALFEGRFQAKHIDREEYLLALSRYIHLNPVAARLVDRPENWEFSSYRDYIGIRNGSLPRPELVLRGLDGTGQYRSYVMNADASADRMIEHLAIDDDR